MAGQDWVRIGSLPPTEAGGADANALSIYLFGVDRDEASVHFPGSTGAAPSRAMPLLLKLRYCIAFRSTDPLLEQVALGGVLQAFQRSPRLLLRDHLRGDELAVRGNDMPREFHVELDDDAGKTGSRLFGGADVPEPLALYYTLRALPIASEYASALPGVTRASAAAPASLSSGGGKQ